MKPVTRLLPWFVFVAFFVVALGTASDLQRGITFSPTEHITNTKLHNLVDETTISTTFVTDKASAQPTASDVFLFVQPGTPIYRKTTYQTMFLGATNLVTSQSENDLPVTNDYFLMFDTSAGSLVKVPLIAIFTNASTTVWGPDYTNWPAGGFSYPYAYQGNSGHLEHSNLFLGWWQWETFDTNVAAVNPLTNSVLASIHTALTNADLIRVWDKASQTGKFSTLIGLITNLPPARPGLTNRDTFAFVQTRTNSVNPNGTNDVLSKLTIADLFTNYFPIPTVSGSFDTTSRVTSADTLLIWSTSTNASPDATNFPAKVALSSLVRRFVTNGIAVASGVAAQGLHGLGGRPQLLRWYFVCGTADGAYVQGDKVPIECAETAAGGATACVGGANFSQVFVKLRVSNPTIPDKTGTGTLIMTPANWTLECEAEFWPYY